MAEQDHLLKTLDQLNTSVVAVLVEQAKTSTSVDQILKEMVKLGAAQQVHGTLLTAHQIQITKLESAIKILTWVAGVLSTVVAGVVVRIITNIIGG